ncbi:PTS glucose transporter subunit IIA [Pseudoalteromonas sp. SSDWG2]|uniref:PTS glucose transporter subunit IIA n=1 Tax=Pseudoalteromonas sp. SSDWG2 TaxID=3139391 RepID=UPI003BAD7C04
MNTSAQFCIASDVPLSEVIYAPASGAIHPLASCKAQLIALGLLGPGICIDMRSHKLLAPVDGYLIEVNCAMKQWRFKANNGSEILVHISHEQESICNKAKFTHINRTRVTKGEELAYFDLRQFQSMPMVAIIVANCPTSKNVLFSHQQVEAGDSLLFIS